MRTDNRYWPGAIDSKWYLPFACVTAESRVSPDLNSTAASLMGAPSSFRTTPVHSVTAWSRVHAAAAITNMQNTTRMLAEYLCPPDVDYRGTTRTSATLFVCMRFGTPYAQHCAANYYPLRPPSWPNRSRGRRRSAYAREGAP